MDEAADAAVELMKALSSRPRLLILCRLVERERSVGELADLLGARYSNVSQHLALLRKDGLVAARRDGQTIWYRIASKPARVLVEALATLYCSTERGALSAPAEIKKETA